MVSAAELVVFDMDRNVAGRIQIKNRQRDTKQTKTDQGQKRNHKEHKERPRKNTELAIMVFVNGTSLLARRFVPLAAAVTPARPVPAPPIVLLLLFCAPPKFMPVVVVGGTTPSNTIRKKKGRNFIKKEPSQ